MLRIDPVELAAELETGLRRVSTHRTTPTRQNSPVELRRHRRRVLGLNREDVQVSRF